MWGICFLILLAVLIWQTFRGNPKRGLGIAVLLSLLVPTWATMGYQNPIDLIESLPVKADLRVTISLVGLLFLLFRPKSVLPLRLHWIDGLMSLLVLLHVCSDSFHSGFSISIVIRAFGEWCLPYLVGRMAICSFDDVRQLVPFAIVVASILAVVAVTECLLRINVAELLFDERPVDGALRSAKRWGYKRAFGPNMHAIYFGVLQLLLIPWTVYAAFRSFQTGRNQWQLATPLACVAGVVATLSRGPILALGFVAYFIVLISKPRWTKALIVVGVIAIGLVAWNQDRILRLMQDWSGETNARKQTQIKVEEESVKYNSTFARIHIYRLYGPALRRAGWLGFGTERVTGFPIRVPTGLQDAEALKKLRAIDNVYILLALRFGYAAPLLFAAMGIWATVVYVRLGLSDRRGLAFYASMGATVAATLLVIITVWMPHDYGFVLIMNIGMAAGLESRRRIDQG